MGAKQKYTDEFMFERLGWDDFKRPDIERLTGCTYHTSVTFLERTIESGTVLRINSREYRVNMPVHYYPELRNVDCDFVNTSEGREEILQSTALK